MNVIELLADLQAQHDKTAARAGELRDQIQHLTAALTETEARLANLVTTRKVIAELAPASGQPAPPETNTAYQAIVNTFNQHPMKSSEPVSCTNASACPPTRHPSTSPAAASDASPAKASSLNPDEAATRSGLDALTGSRPRSSLSRAWTRRTRC